LNLQCRVELGKLYKAGPQIARVVSEDWCARELYCAACSSDRLLRSKANTPAVDLICPQCGRQFQLKSLRLWGQRKIVDAAYKSMIRAIRSDKVPDLLILQYSSDWFVRNLMLVPSVFFSETVIEKRAPLGPAARRAGWVGCNILLDRIVQDGKIAVVSDGSALPEKQVRREYSRVRRLSDVPPTVRGWTLDVLGAVRGLAKSRFSLRELYALEPSLRTLHPRNQNVRPKIRQQLQVLRDLGLIRFTGPGNYELKE
jgi:type II restriction enzyme